MDESMLWDKKSPIRALVNHIGFWLSIQGVAGLVSDRRWLHVHARSQECPVCKAVVEEDKLVPLYGRGKTPTDPRSRSVPGVDIPHRPAGQRPATAAPPDPNQFGHTNPWFMGGAPFGHGSFGSFTFPAAISGLFPMLSFQVHGFPDATGYGSGAGFHYGYNSFHGGHAYGFPPRASQGQQADYYLKALLLLKSPIRERIGFWLSIQA
ncbi:hypothetical protein J5N97_008603 [Dioscorea zingiberensis]|uniref:E3 ubiquitin-protein ligase RMA n=1 Tax=Dioscorea zingiberensis TaxID=325984 RepID=A0A9D5CXT0_9LILI|nr:hypothetical protein J5N97_008603 [Dioscorea zingiberensis]